MDNGGGSSSCDHLDVDVVVARNRSRRRRRFIIATYCWWDAFAILIVVVVVGSAATRHGLLVAVPLSASGPLQHEAFVLRWPHAQAV